MSTTMECGTCNECGAALEPGHSEGNCGCTDDPAEPARNLVHPRIALDDFTKAYLHAALWSSNDEDYGDGTNLDANYDIADFCPDTIRQAVEDCIKFRYDNTADLAVAYEEYTESGAIYHPDAGSADVCAGHDFWFSRAGHGTGYWDRGLSVGETLHGAARKFKEIDLYTHLGEVKAE